MPMVWIADEAAFNQYRQQSGSFDVMQVEQIYEAHRAKYGLQFRLFDLGAKLFRRNRPLVAIEIALG